MKALPVRTKYSCPVTVGEENSICNQIEGIWPECEIFIPTDISQKWPSEKDECPLSNRNPSNVSLSSAKKPVLSRSSSHSANSVSPNNGPPSSQKRQRQIHDCPSSSHPIVSLRGAKKPVLSTRLDTPSNSPHSANSVPSYKSRRSASSKVNFLGRRIAHKWNIEEDTNKQRWFNGTVLSVVSGKDGNVDAVYEILYDGDSDSYEVDNLRKDYSESSVRFIDV
ncbi:uncharacterized protein LOC117334049 [Pecten maximus]|uniref:uncharacterized protein LOC117334049 n=1 Tax=Pecten maximus TaxID=6579 RepID=UPI0014591729|nr:uncharacterized protein LOC117334049 [Pecten maximus]